MKDLNKVITFNPQNAKQDSTVPEPYNVPSGLDWISFNKECDKRDAVVLERQYCFITRAIDFFNDESVNERIREKVERDKSHDSTKTFNQNLKLVSLKTRNECCRILEGRFFKAIVDNI